MEISSWPCPKTLADYFAPFRQRRKELLENREEISEILAAGAEKAQKVAQKTMEDVRQIIGVR